MNNLIIKELTLIAERLQLSMSTAVELRDAAAEDKAKYRKLARALEKALKALESALNTLEN